MKSLREKLGITKGEFKVNTKIDDSGDYEYKTYDILACFPWGVRGVVYEMYNPIEARLFCAAPEMLEALIECRNELAEQYGQIGYSTVDNATSVIEKAIGKSLEEI